MNPIDNALRLPGVVCETRPPNLAARPLRLDVAGFVGLAERGPLDLPVLIEDVSQYRLIFGGDLPLARAEGLPVFAHLFRAVEAFFANGGRRCYVVRVAGAQARANQFQAPGLLYDAGGGNWQPVIVPAASPGRWSDLISLAGGLRLRPLPIRTTGPALEIAGGDIAAGSYRLPLRLPTPTALQAGDLLRLHLRRPSGENYHLYVRAAGVDPERTLGGIQLAGVPVIVHPRAPGALFRTDPGAVTPQSVAVMTAGGWVDLPFAPADYTWSNSSATPVAWRLGMPLPAVGAAPDATMAAGALLRISGPGGLNEAVFFAAEQVGRRRESGVLRLALDSAHPLQAAGVPVPEPYTVLQVDVLSFDLLVREGETTMESWSDLRFGGPTRNWRALLQPPVDRSIVYPPAFTVDHFTAYSLRLGGSTATPGAWEDPLILPLGIGALPVFGGPRPDTLPVSKDGLDAYDPEALFVDAAFAAVGVRNLLTTANDLQHLAAQPRRLRGMHSLIPVDEAALIALPDLAHLGWEQFDQPQLGGPVVKPPEPQAPHGFHDCAPAPVDPQTKCPKMPAVVIAPVPDPAVGAGDQIAGDRVALAALPEQLPPAGHDDKAMREVQRAAIRLCAGRADMVALLNLPHHYDTQAAGQWHEDLVTTPDFYDGDPLSYAALYHPWPAIREQTTPALAPLRYEPPDGFVAGTIAAREILRGAWIAPANVPLQNAVDLAAVVDEGDWAHLYARRLNIVRRQPGRYALMSAMTLSHDRTLRQLSVRRLLILLRKLALREGQRYVFETNNDRFRALVQTYFENILTRILDRGGLHAFQVVTSEEINTPADYDNGRFLVALKVAPTLPIEYITITMLRTGDDAIAVLGG